MLEVQNTFTCLCPLLLLVIVMHFNSIYIWNSTLHYFVKSILFWIFTHIYAPCMSFFPISDHLTSAWWIHLSVYFSAGLLVSNSLGSCLSGNNLILLTLLEDIFAGYRTLSYQLILFFKFSFSNLKIPCYFFLACIFLSCIWRYESFYLKHLQKYSFSLQCLKIHYDVPNCSFLCTCFYFVALLNL